MIDQTIPEARRVATKLGVAGLEAARAICGTATRDLVARMPKELKDLGASVYAADVCFLCSASANMLILSANG